VQSRPPLAGAARERDHTDRSRLRVRSLAHESSQRLQVVLACLRLAHHHEEEAVVLALVYELFKRLASL
jgi:hypothetical protein